MKPHRNQTTLFLMLLLLRLQSKKRHSSSGYTLVITIAVLLVLSVLLITYAITSKVDSVSSTATAKSNTGFYSAEAGLNRRAERIRAKFVGYNLPNGTPPRDASGQVTWKACIKPGGTPGTGDFQCETDVNIGIQPVTTYIEDLTLGTPNSIVIPAGELFSGLSAQEYRYNVLSIAQDKQTQPTAILGMQFKSRLIPLFQFAAFYDQDMDVQIPPTMTLNGPVHSNNDLYLNAAGPATLTIQGQVTAAGSLYRGEKQDSTCAGTVNIYDPTNPKALPCAGARQLFPTSTLGSWNNQIRVGIAKLRVPDIGEFDATPGRRYWDAADLRVALDLTTSPPSVQVRTQSDTSDSSGTSTLKDTTCAPIQAQTSAAVTNSPIISLASAPSPSFSPDDVVTLGDDPHIYFVQSAAGTNVTLTAPVTTSGPTTIRKAIVSYSEDTFKNYREKRGNFGTGPTDYTPIKILNVDMRGLLGCASSLMGGKALDDDTEGGLVWFLTVKGPDSNPTPPASNDYGVRIYNGQDLSSPVSGIAIKGLSVVSDQAVYIRGDYNCGSSTTCNNGNDDDDIRKPAAVMADTINVLSNNWPLDDSFSNSRISSGSSFGNEPTAGRPASPTTIDAAFLAGIDITGVVNRGGQNQGYATAGGGLNNYPRFHEDWSNGFNGSNRIDFTYQGSMVSLGAPRKVNGRWCGSGSTANCNIYNPPNRLWRYDPLFNNAANLPPLSPRAVFLKQELFSRSFEQVSRPIPTFWALLSPSHWLGLLTTQMQAHH
jgi:hypothetical protein